jgi:hypothetical protein
MSDLTCPNVPPSAPALPPAGAGDLPPEIWGDALGAAAAGVTTWLWDGYLAHGNVTLLTSQWKSGKTTLLALLLARREAGGQLAGLAVRPGRTAVVTEEAALLWNERRQKLGFGPSAAFLCRPFPGKPTTGQWLALIERLADLRARRDVDLAVIDPLAAFLPGRGESHADLILEALLPLRRLTALGVAVLLLHHPRKGAVADGQAARGSGALAGLADVVIEMRHHGRAAALDRRRVLYGYSRHERTPHDLVIELNPEGTDYHRLGALDDLEFAAAWAGLRGAFEGAHTKLTRADVAAHWPAGEECPAEVTLRRRLEEAVARGLLRREGPGTKGSPYRYWLPGQEEKWKDDPLHRLHESVWQAEAFARESRAGEGFPGTRRR